MGKTIASSAPPEDGGKQSESILILAAVLKGRCSIRVKRGVRIAGVTIHSRRKAIAINNNQQVGKW